jgi:hypothetical protein
MREVIPLCANEKRSIGMRRSFAKKGLARVPWPLRAEPPGQTTPPRALTGAAYSYSVNYTQNDINEAPGSVRSGDRCSIMEYGYREQRVARDKVY